MYLEGIIKSPLPPAKPPFGTLIKGVKQNNGVILKEIVL
jgi:hypothetical protein